MKFLGIHRYIDETRSYPPIAVDSDQYTTGTDGLVLGYRVTKTKELSRLYCMPYVYTKLDPLDFKFEFKYRIFTPPYPVINGFASWVAIIPPTPSLSDSGYSALSFDGLSTYTNYGTTYINYSSFSYYAPFIVTCDAEVYGEPPFDPNRPCYRHLITGYELDTRPLPSQLVLLSGNNETVLIGYYRRNYLEPISDLISIDWIVERVSLFAGVAKNLDVPGFVLGTLDDPSSVVTESISEYPRTALLPSGLGELFRYWEQIYTDNKDATLFDIYDIHKIYILNANNNVWLNNSNILPDTISNFTNNNPYHPLFTVDNQLAYDRHIAPQLDGSTGTLVMDSPRIINTLAIVADNQIKILALKTQLDLIKAKVDTLFATDLTSVAKADKLAEVKTQIDLIKTKVDTIDANTILVRDEII
jgi:hypothetical protein